MAIKVVLVNPEIPQNTGNIARTCAATGAELHLVGTLGFSIKDTAVKRAGLDYWDKVHIVHHHTLDTFLHEINLDHCFFTSPSGNHRYDKITYPNSICYLFFGSESKGLPTDILNQYSAQTVFLPMSSNIRSLNLANSVAILVYEALRQQGFPFHPHKFSQQHIHQTKEFAQI